ncbi:hypothetical protein SUGI_0120170 [Cryptomeria japonica]|nr:hypothetical protein SUGI_0120170 [Cryptomeria japonica]
MIISGQKKVIFNTGSKIRNNSYKYSDKDVPAQSKQIQRTTNPAVDSELNEQRTVVTVKNIQSQLLTAIEAWIARATELIKASFLQS